jgi:hypothetical protein
LKTTARTALDMTYEKVKKILVDKNIKSKEAYIELCKHDVRIPPEPKIIFRQFTNWINFLSIQRIYYEMDICKQKITEYILTYPEIKQYYLDLDQAIIYLCKIDNHFPPVGLWTEYYDVKNLQELIHIQPPKKKCMGLK